MDQQVFIALVQTFGLPLALLMFALITGALDMWVYGKRYRELLEDRDYWREQALRNTDLAETAVQAPARRPRARPARS
jgi:hypothetical protein